MEYREFTRIMSETDHQIEGYITVANESFAPKSYPWNSRTYLVSSNNKAYQAGKAGYSIFGTSVDMSDVGVRLDLYLKNEHGGNKGWLIEDCGIVLYQLVRVEERDVTVCGFYSTEGDAHKAMVTDFANVVGCEEDALDEFFEEKDGEILDTTAWANDVGANDGNADWSIHRVFVPFPVSWTVKMKKKQKETQDILSYHTQAAGCSDKARAKASGGRQPIEECGRTGL